MKRFICIFLSVFVVFSIFVLGLSAEDRVVPPVDSIRATVLPSSTEFAFSVSYSDISSPLSSWLWDSGYSLFSHSFIPNFDYFTLHNGSFYKVTHLWVTSSGVFFTLETGSQSYDASSYSFYSDSSLFYSWLINDVGVSSSVVSTRGGIVGNTSARVVDVLGWVGSFVNSVFTGGLSGLLIMFAIGIGVTVLCFGIKAIKGFTWGS